MYFREAVIETESVLRTITRVTDIKYDHCLSYSLNLSQRDLDLHSGTTWIDKVREYPVLIIKSPWDDYKDSKSKCNVTLSTYQGL